jgi:hypothetical protein
VSPNFLVEVTAPSVNAASLVGALRLGIRVLQERNYLENHVSQINTEHLLGI